MYKDTRPKKEPLGIEEDVLNEIVRRIVQVAEPERIVLFRPHVRGSAAPSSDLDLLVIKRGQYHRGRLTEEIYMGLIGVRQAVDVVLVTPKDIERYQKNPALVIAPALHEGRTSFLPIYAPAVTLTEQLRA